MSAKDFQKIRNPSGEPRGATATVGVDPCKGMAKPAAGDVSDSQHGLSLDQRALDAALSAWHATYRNHPVTDRQEFEEAVAEAVEDALATYLRETRPVNWAPVTFRDFLEPDDVVLARGNLHVRPWGEQ